MTPERFFHEVLPPLAGPSARAFPALAGKICVVVGSRVWTLSLHDDVDAVIDGPDATAPTQWWLSEDAFAALMAGRVDAIGPNEAGLRGDPLVIEQLGRLLGGGGVNPFERARPVTSTRDRPASAALSRARELRK